MTVLVCVRILAGMVLAADSRETTIEPDRETAGHTVRFDDTKQKIVGLHDDLPIAAMNWQHGFIGDVPMRGFFDRLRTELMGLGTLGDALDPSAYTIEQVVNVAVALAKKVLVESALVRRLDAIQGVTEEGGGPPEAERFWRQFPYTTGLVFAGYSADNEHPELWRLLLPSGRREPDRQCELRPGRTPGLRSFAQNTTITRLYGCRDEERQQATDRSVAGRPAVSCTVEETSPVNLKMSLKQAAQFAGFLVNTEIDSARVASKNPRVGGPIRIATLTRAEGFRALTPVSPWTPSLVDPGTLTANGNTPTRSGPTGAYPQQSRPVLENLDAAEWLRPRVRAGDEQHAGK